MRVATVRLTLYLPGAHSLKEKRRAIKGLKERLAAKFNLSIAETGHHDMHQTAELGVAMVAADGEDLHGRVDAVVRYVQLAPDVQLGGVETEFL